MFFKIRVAITGVTSVKLFSATQNKGFLPVLGTFVPASCSYFPHASGHSSWVKLGNELREFFQPFLQEHLATNIPGQPGDILDIYVEKMKASEDDTSSSFHDGKH